MNTVWEIRLNFHIFEYNRIDPMFVFFHPVSIADGPHAKKSLEDPYPKEYMGMVKLNSQIVGFGIKGKAVEALQESDEGGMSSIAQYTFD